MAAHACTLTWLSLHGCSCMYTYLVGSAWLLMHACTLTWLGLYGCSCMYTYLVGSVLSLLLLKKDSSARLGETDVHPISPKTPAPQYEPIDRKKRKGKRVEDYSRDRAA